MNALKCILKKLYLKFQRGFLLNEKENIFYPFAQFIEMRWLLWKHLLKISSPPPNDPNKKILEYWEKSSDPKTLLVNLLNIHSKQLAYYQRVNEIWLCVCILNELSHVPRKKSPAFARKKERDTNKHLGEREREKLKPGMLCYCCCCCCHLLSL